MRLITRFQMPNESRDRNAIERTIRVSAAMKFIFYFCIFRFSYLRFYAIFIAILSQQFFIAMHLPREFLSLREIVCLAIEKLHVGSATRVSGLSQIAVMSWWQLHEGSSGINVIHIHVSCEL